MRWLRRWTHRDSPQDSDLPRRPTLPRSPRDVTQLAGIRLGQYQISSIDGDRSNDSRTYRYCATTGEQRVTITVFNNWLARDEGFHSRFYQEMRAVACLEHPNIQPVLDYGSSQDLYYTVSPEAVGRTLRLWLHHAWNAGIRAPEDDVYVRERQIAVLREVLAALDYAHSRGIVHGSIRGSDIVGVADAAGQLANFGIARIAYPMGPSPPQPKRGRTLALSHPGLYTDRFRISDTDDPSDLAPELVNGWSALGQTDLYAVGLLLFEILAGSTPFDKQYGLERMHQHLSAEIPLPSVRNPGLSPAWDEVIQRSLAKHPVDRYASARAMDEAIDLALRAQQTRNRAGPPGVRSLVATEEQLSHLAWSQQQVRTQTEFRPSTIGSYLGV